MKSIKAPTKQGKNIAVIAPNIHFLSFIKSGKYNYADILAGFGIFGIEEGIDKNEFEIVMKDLDNMIIQICHFCKEIRKYEASALKWERGTRRIKNYKVYQILLGYIEAYLDKLHSLGDLIKNIDKLYSSDFYSQLEKKSWYKIQIGLRHLFHHIESPLITSQSNHILIVCKKAKEVNRYKKYFDDRMFNKKGRLEVKFIGEDLESDLLNFLNKMAKEILERITPETQKMVIAGFDKNGNLIPKEISLQQLLEKID